MLYETCGYRLYKLGILAVFLTYGQLEKTVLRVNSGASVHKERLISTGDELMFYCA
jgi:hypothetical protein